MRTFIGIVGLALLYISQKKKRGDVRDNRYFPVQSSSERVAGHPIVGVS